MEFLYTPVFINITWIAAAFLFGFAVRQVGLPPMIGFLGAGFALHFLGITEGSLALDSIADMGVMLLLFTIGLKLDLKSLAKPEIWMGTTIHMILSVIFFGGIIMVLSTLGLAAFAGMQIYQAALVGFALSFLSTIFAIKTLEDNGELNSAHAGIAIGVLIMQDIIAVIFITMSKGKFPSIWALGIPLFIFALRPLLMFFIDRAGHGEMLTLAGFFTAIVVGATGFHLLGMKADLGALVMGVVVGSHPRASELGKSLYSFKDMFLVGFFFQIGLVALPQLSHLLIALGFVAIMLVKSGFFFAIFTRFGLRSRTSFMATINLSNYSEFGLIVAAIAAKEGWLDNDWLLILSLALTLSFIMASTINSRAGAIYEYCSPFLKRFESHEAEQLAEIDLGEASIMVLGMGRIGLVTYDTMRKKYGHEQIIGIDQDNILVDELAKNGRNIILADTSDQEFWAQIKLDNISLIMFAIPNLTTCLFSL
ncbi:MAG: cation:proton antiporter, partial [Deltaproteobacteria bacterium]|nr:cation:proton antiporter [Deltaproteobacteria bacterium]